MRGDSLARQLRLFMLLEERREMSVPDVAGELGTTQRTIYRDLHVLERVGFPIYSEPQGRTARWRLVDGYRRKLNLTRVDAPLEWLAFKGLALFPSFPRGVRIITTAVSGRGEELRFTWPLWSLPASLATVRSLVPLGPSAGGRERSARGVFASCSSSIRRTPQGFGNFGPATVTS